MSQQSLEQDHQQNEIGTIPFDLSTKDDLEQRILEQFDYLNNNLFLINDHLITLRDQYYNVNTQIEQITFPNIQQSVNMLLENIDINGQEETVIMAVLNNIIAKFQYRQKLPYSVHHFRQFLSENNVITVKTKGINYNSIDSICYFLFLEKLMQIRPDTKETYAAQLEISKCEAQSYHPISEDDVWFSHCEIVDENTVAFHFIVITFDVREKLQEYLIPENNEEQNATQESYHEPEQQPWYGTKKYDIVDHVLKLQAEKDKLAQRSAVQEASLRAQQPYMTMTMKDISQQFEGPPKYLNQRDSPLEIPMEIIKSFFTVVDQDMDDRISIDELNNYAKLKYLPFSEDIIIQMFKEASQGRGIVHSKQREAPLTLDEVAAAVRGRHRWNPRTKEWEVSYRPCRDYWIIFLQTISERLFAMPIPKVVPTKIVAQFEEEEMKMKMKTMGGNAGGSTMGICTIMRKEGLDKKYLSVKDQKTPIFQRETEKYEAGITPEATIKIGDKKQKRVDKNPYEHQINARIQGNQESTPNGFPKVTFEAKEFFNQATLLSQVIPHWKSDKANPIYTYVPTTERPFTNDSDTLFNVQLQQKMFQQSMREQRLTELQGKERTLQLAGTMALYNSKTSPWDVMKERQGFVTKFKVPTILDQKMESQKTAKNEKDSFTGGLKPIQDPYNPPSDHKFRDLEIPRGQKDFTLRFKCPPAYNHNGVSEHDLRPKEVLEKQRNNEERDKERKQREYEAILKGKPLESKPAWVQYHKLPDLLTPVAQDFKDMYSKTQAEKNPFLDKEEFTPAYLQLARQMKDDVVFGKPNFNLYYKTMKPGDLNEEFGGVKTKPFKCIY